MIDPTDLTYWIRLPQNAPELHKDLLSDRLKTREQFLDTVLDCGKVLGDVQCAGIICARLENELQKQSWTGVEACLIAATALIAHLPDSESQVLPRLLQYTPHFPEHKFVRYVFFASMWFYFWTDKV